MVRAVSKLPRAVLDTSVATALEGSAEYIVTEDARDLLSLKVIKVRIAPAAERQNALPD